MGSGGLRMLGLLVLVEVALLALVTGTDQGIPCQVRLLALLTCTDQGQPLLTCLALLT